MAPGMKKSDSLWKLPILMAKLRKDLSGKVFGKLTAITFIRRQSGKAIWQCQCACGLWTEVDGYNLSSGHTVSCGCQKFIAPAAVVIHGKSKDRVHKIWRGMLARCENPNEPMFYRYGGRGIKVCERWHTFTNFYADMGDPPDGQSIDRFPNNNGNYEKGNCRWATPIQQARNKSNNRLISKDGITLPLVAWAEKLGIKEGTLRARSERGCPENRLLDPVR
jgi:hypothetical protein